MVPDKKKYNKKGGRGKNDEENEHYGEFNDDDDNMKKGLNSNTI